MQENPSRQVTFDQITKINKVRAQRWHNGPLIGDWNLADWSNALNGEAGELANIIKKIRRVECGFAEDDPNIDFYQMAAEEIADVFLYLDLLATAMKIDLPTAIVDKFNKVSEREGFPERL